MILTKFPLNSGVRDLPHILADEKAPPIFLNETVTIKLLHNIMTKNISDTLESTALSIPDFH